MLTYNRPTALQKILANLEDLELDGDLAALEIFIDRTNMTEAYDNKSYDVARVFGWSGGQTRVHVRRTHVGLYGQWVDCWRPRPGTREIALVLEDDVLVSR